ncbi:MAG: Nif3-like dinuclear metal center hexameric protein [Dethiobacter sp.]|nr:Nif3-like dinuclear metal center hexameric protein [Dethiobacter sp.]MCL4463308.1 Nif3-like dinuclear metal center hexameric protein [Bacillota bacterium]MCL5994068.1 Nif3-like dinuclear metal center hexameric protein [Bacillota bacterium]
MLLQAQTLIHYLEELAPKRLAFDWDQVGLQLGSSHGTVKKVLVALDFDERVLAEASSVGADFILTHHPFIFRPLSAVRTDLPQGRLLAAALAAGVRIYASHTNLDVVSGGVNDALAARLGLHELEVLQVRGTQCFEKIAVFVPSGHEDKLRDALAAAGAGWIGSYSHCTFQSPGTGTFIPWEGTNPHIGEQGKLERVAEIRLETIYPAELRKRVVSAMLKAHPYEEAAYDLYPLLNAGKAYGLGRTGKLEQACTLDEFCAVVKEKLELTTLRLAGEAKQIKKVAVCGGSGGELLQAAQFAGADVLVTGDLKYHQAKEAEAMGIAVIDAGHDATERVIIPVLCTYLRDKFAQDGYDVEVLASAVSTAPWKTL